MVQSDSVEIKINEGDVVSAAMSQTIHFTLIVHPNDTTIGHIYTRDLDKYLPFFWDDNKKEISPSQFSYFLMMSQSEYYIPPRLHIDYRQREDLSSFEAVLHQVEKDMAYHPTSFRAFMAFNYLAIEDVFSLSTYPKTNILDYSHALGRTLKKVGLKRLSKMYESSIRYRADCVAEESGSEQSKRYLAFNKLIAAQLLAALKRIKANASSLDNILTGANISSSFSLAERNYPDGVLEIFEDSKREFNKDVEKELIRLGYLVENLVE